jgi:predicted ATPase
MTEGNPLFVTESVRVMLAGPDEYNGEPAATVLPAKIHAVISQRLARLSPPARELANLAAVIGRSFTLPVLAHAYGADEDLLVQGLDELWQRRIVREQAAESYDFSHDLIRETAYSSISLARRRLLHRRVAEALEQTAGRERLLAAQIAWHYEQAGQHDSAVNYYSQAAAVAQQMYAYQDAIGYLERALALLANLPSDQKRVEQEIDLLSALGAAWSVVKTYAAFEAKQAFDRALALSRHLKTSPHLFVALWGLHEFHLARSEYDHSLYIAEQCLRMAQDLQEPDLLIEAHHAMWGALVFMNRYSTAVAHVDQALLWYRWEQHHQLALQYGGHDPGHCGLLSAATALWVSGYPDQARHRMVEGIELTRHFSIPSSLADAAYNQTMIYQFLGEEQAALESAETTVRLSQKHGYRLGEAFGFALIGWARTMLGDHTGGLTLLKQGMEQWRNEGMHNLQTYLNILWIEACCTAGQIEAGIASAESAHTFGVEFGELFFAPEIYRLHGELLLRQGQQHATEVYCQQAIALARQQDAKSLELRSATSLAHLWQAQGKQSAAYDLLAPIYNWFSEGFDTPDLQAAHDLLQLLAT